MKKREKKVSEVFRKHKVKKKPLNGTLKKINYSSYLCWACTFFRCFMLKEIKVKDLNPAL